MIGRLSTRYRRKTRHEAAVVHTAGGFALLAAAEPGKARMLFTTMYGCGLRVSEGIALEVTDIDSQRKVIHIRKGKGRKDRYVPLGENLLEQLRDYWRTHKPSRFLFPGSQADKRWTSDSWFAKSSGIAVRIAGIEKACTTHTLRHSYTRLIACRQE